MHSLIRHRFWSLMFAMSYPTLLTLTYFWWLSSSSSTVQQIVYATGKVIQFGFPLVYVISVVGLPVFGRAFRSTTGAADANEVRPIDTGWFLKDTASTSFWVGLLFGLAVVLAMLLLYHFILPATLVEHLHERVQAKVKSMGLSSPGTFLALSLFYVIGHSLLEEYYWRWFVFDQLQQSMSMWKANWIAGFAFMAHHVVLLAMFFGWNSLFTYLISLSVAVGGLFWAWLFNRRQGFRSAWLSHAIVDAGIFGLAIAILRQ